MSLFKRRNFWERITFQEKTFIEKVEDFFVAFIGTIILIVIGIFMLFEAFPFLIDIIALFF